MPLLLGMFIIRVKMKVEESDTGVGGIAFRFALVAIGLLVLFGLIAGMRTGGDYNGVIDFYWLRARLA